MLWDNQKPNSISISSKAGKRQANIWSAWIRSWLNTPPAMRGIGSVMPGKKDSAVPWKIQWINLIFSFILLDDSGWADLSCYGSDFYETPNLDRLATQSMRFTDAYAACPVCSPTRASIMSGKYPARLGLTNYIAWENPGLHQERARLIDAPYIPYLDTQEKNLAKSMKENGYATWPLGKWHMGKEKYWPGNGGPRTNAQPRLAVVTSIFAFRNIFYAIY